MTINKTLFVFPKPTFFDIEFYQQIVSVIAVCVTFFGKGLWIFVVNKWRMLLGNTNITGFHLQ